ncbi:MAG: ATP-dependent helicase [Drouetiella hepatica Uher 2000/2452]|jgi:DNA helicase-2/ATP-dependent DNA helicase PcrA|uniref:DNA 3'-5' helicase n=1 Tax=Drouetiella hepatica Uher 2000/2452 TaxID=904376 RepID=A0A951QG29_9CYAN|nr:ATP-dependent helicase [Drouetiella hepatica Uher 2000/2452]
MFSEPAFLESAVPHSREQIFDGLRQSLRPGQQRMADWQGGSLAVSAVPGSGKSTGMAIAAALFLARRYLSQVESQNAISQDAMAQDPALLQAKPLPAGQLILVTFTRSAVANLKGKVRQYLKELALAPQGFAVSTLHGLALNIATRHPTLSGLNLSQATLVSPNQSSRLIRTCVEQWISAHPKTYQQLIEGQQFDGEESERLRRQSVLRTEVLPDLAFTVIHEAKSSGLLPKDLQNMGRDTVRYASEGADYDVLAIASGLYERYQVLLRSRNFIDYDDMILAALRVLEDEATRRHWQTQVCAVFEDEAQDSSPLQTQLLQILAADPTNPHQSLNLIRVGDPNQAINSTFTPADPLFFREFCQACDRLGNLAEMDQAGRSSLLITEAANFLLDWVNQKYQAENELPFRTQYIHAVPSGDPQPDANPEPEGAGLEIRFPPDVHQTVNLIGLRIAELVARYPEARAAVLVRENRQGRYIAERLQNPALYGLDVDLGQLGIDIYDVGARDRHSHIPAEILALLQFLDRPHSPDYLKAALQTLVDRRLIPTQDLNTLVVMPERFLYPSPIDPPQSEPVLQARRYCTGLLRARLELPQYQLIPFLAMTLQYDQSELATAEKLAERLIQQTIGNPAMTAVLEVLEEIVRSERFEPVEIDDPEQRYIRPRQLTIITMHKAKGLDWDFVFIPFLHEHMLPGNLRVLPQMQFLGDFTLSEVARAQIRARIHQSSGHQSSGHQSSGHQSSGHPSSIPDIAIAWERAKWLKIAEEYRLLYVAMTRAKRLLWMSAAHKAPFSWSNPDNLDGKLPCPILPALVKQFPQSMRKKS